MTENMNLILNRGNKLQDIVKDSEDLSQSAKDFLGETKKLKRCACFSLWNLLDIDYYKL